MRNFGQRLLIGLITFGIIAGLDLFINHFYPTTSDWVYTAIFGCGLILMTFYIRKLQPGFYKKLNLTHIIIGSLIFLIILTLLLIVLPHFR